MVFHHEALAAAGLGGLSRDHRPALGCFPGARRGGWRPEGQCPSAVEVVLQPSGTRGQEPSLLLFSRVRLFAPPWTAAGRASPAFTIPWSLLRLTSILILTVTLDLQNMGILADVRGRRVWVPSSTDTRQTYNELPWVLRAGRRSPGVLRGGAWCNCGEPTDPEERLCQK